MRKVMTLLVAVIDEPIRKHSKISWNENKVGGTPIWLANSKSSAIPRCKGCTQEMTFVVQMYCPLSDSAYHRCLYLFACSAATCPQRNSWRLLRSVQLDSSYVKVTDSSKSKDFDDDMWIDNQDDWGGGMDADDWGEGSNADDWGEGSNADDWGEGSKADDCGEGSKEATGQSVCDESDQAQEDKPVEAEKSFCKEESNQSNSYRLPPQLCTDEDLSSTLEKMAVSEDKAPCEKDEQGAEDSSGKPPPCLLEELGLSTPKGRLDELATVLNTQDCQEVSTPKSSSLVPLILKPYYLSVIEAHRPSRKEGSDDRHVTDLIRDYELTEGKSLKELLKSSSAKGKAAASSEAYEKSDLKHGDRVFHKFLKELQKLPEQCIRYDRGGKPLLVRTVDPSEASIPRCQACGSDRVFEFQLTPALIPWLQSCDGAPSGIEFGTVLVYTCSQNCVIAEGDVAEEHVLALCEPDQHLYR